MGLDQHDRFKELKIMQDADLIVSECRSLIEQHALDPGKAREVVVKAMLGDQPLPLKGTAAATVEQPGRRVSDASIAF